MNSAIKSIIDLSSKMRKVILEMSLNCGQSAHIGGGLSIVDILASLYEGVGGFSINKLDNRFILSKGHGVLGLLSVLHCKNFISKDDILTFQTNGSEFIAHPIANHSLGIESSNGSLGQGLSFGIGIALSYKKKNNNGNIFVLMGDGECYEGSVWEASITATETNLNNLTAIIDCNGHQNDGEINLKMNFTELSKKWNGFGWNVISCDGHNHMELLNALKFRHESKPTVIIAKTIKGKGVKFMENNNDWHHNRLTQKLFDEAMLDL
jgi:transketolase|tara:strand:+ start:2709 stop:3506 length:798 start_codon:yes stop_codon:yes gene_type:complete